MWLDDLLQTIPLPDREAIRSAQARQLILTKPAGSLGRLEDLAIQIAGITGNAIPKLTHKVVVTIAGDHGIVAEGVSAYPQDVTTQMLANFQSGGAAINVLANLVGARLVVVDVGASKELPNLKRVIDKKVSLGTANMTRGPAMSTEQALQAMKAGVDVVEAELKKGLDALALGEMGIGNTESAAAIAAILTGRDPSDLIGRGTGVDDAGLAKKVVAVRRAIEVNSPIATDPLDVLAKVGGFELAALAGATLAAAKHRRPVIVDGYPATAAVMIAAALAPRLRPFLIASHLSQENGHRIMLDWLGLNPLFDLGMRLGEGTGAVLGMFFAEAACRLLGEMATFQEAGVSTGEDL